MNNLPELPRVLKKQESKFSLVFKKWIKKNPRFSCTIELKDTRGKSHINFSELSDEQIAYGKLISSSTGVLIRVQGLNGEPDYIWCRNMPAYVVIRYPHFFCLISIDTFLLEKKRSVRRSLTSTRANEISTLTIKL